VVGIASSILRSLRDVHAAKPHRVDRPAQTAMMSPKSAEAFKNEFGHVAKI